MAGAWGHWSPAEHPPAARTRLGMVALAAFLVTQLLDGLYTYAGVLTFGIGVEANPIVAALMNQLGHGPGLIGAKVVASCLGVCLYLRQTHTLVAMLTGFYLTAAVAPWTLIFFF